MVKQDYFKDIMEKLIKFTSKNYSVDKINNFEQISSGKTNLSYKIKTDKGDFVLKQYIYKDEERIKTIVRIKQYLAGKKIPAVPPIKNIEGSYYSKLNGNYIALFPFVNGTLFSDSTNIPKEALFSAAKILAKIHLLSKNGLPNLTKRIYYGWDIKIFKKAVDIVREAMKNQDDDFKETAEKLLNLKLKIANENKLAYSELNLKNDHFCYGDYQSQNLIYDDNLNIIAVLDLEIARNAPRVLELMRATDLFCFRGKFDDKNFSLAKIFIDEYKKIYPIKNEEMAAGVKAYFYSEYVYTTWLEERHYIQGNNRSDVFANAMLASLVYFSKNLETFTEKINAK